MTAHIRRFAALPRAHRWLLLRALLAVAVVRLALLALPFRRVCGFVCRRTPGSPGLRDATAQQIAWAVAVAARRVPGARCLPQALSLQWLLTRGGHGAILRVGVAKDRARGLESHAWVEYRGRVILGDEPGLARFVPILAAGAEAT